MEQPKRPFYELRSEGKDGRSKSNNNKSEKVAYEVEDEDIVDEAVEDEEDVEDIEEEGEDGQKRRKKRQVCKYWLRGKCLDDRIVFFFLFN